MGPINKWFENKADELKLKEAKLAEADALEGVQQQQQPILNGSSQDVSNQAWKESELREIEAFPTRQPMEVEDIGQNFTVSGVYFTCPLVGPEVLPQSAIEDKMRKFFYNQLEEERGLTACLMIHTLNKSKLIVQKGIDTLNIYLSNIIDNPTEEKYRKIRLKNKVFQKRVADLEGAFDFLAAAGFSRQMLKLNKEEEEYFILQNDDLDIEKLKMLKVALYIAEPILPILYRNLKVLKPVDVVDKEIKLPEDFFNLTSEEVKREQKSRSETVETLCQLRTKAMREKETQNRHIYKYCLIRVRFPDGIILQGTFSVHENLWSVKEFVAKNLMVPNFEFELLPSIGNKPIDDSQSLLEMGLVPAVVLNYKPLYDGSAGNSFLNSDCMSLLSDK